MRGKEQNRDPDQWMCAAAVLVVVVRSCYTTTTSIIINRRYSLPTLLPLVPARHTRLLLKTQAQSNFLFSQQQLLQCLTPLLLFPIFLLQSSFTILFLYKKIVASEQ